MKLKKLKEVIDACVDNAEELDPCVEIWLGDKLYDITSIGQFGMIPDVSIHIVECHKEDVLTAGFV